MSFISARGQKNAPPSTKRAELCGENQHKTITCLLRTFVGLHQPIGDQFFFGSKT